jgi:hypothetical protein
VAEAERRQPLLLRSRLDWGEVSPSDEDQRVSHLAVLASVEMGERERERVSRRGLEEVRKRGIPEPEPGDER